MPLIPPGPTGIFPAGGPLVPRDRGELACKVTVVPNRRALTMDFGTRVDFVVMHAGEAHALAATLRAMVEKHFGTLTFEAAPLAEYVAVRALHSRKLIQIAFSAASMVGAQGVLAANPELFLALAQRVDEEVAALGSAA